MGDYGLNNTRWTGGVCDLDSCNGQNNIIQVMQSSIEILLYLEEGHLIIETAKKKELEKALHIVIVFDIIIHQFLIERSCFYG